MNDQINTGGSAFPLPLGSQDLPEPQYGGMTLRDWFAGQWINGSVGNSFGMRCLAELDIDEDKARNLMASMAYKMADAMIAEREKGDAK